MAMYPGPGDESVHMSNGGNSDLNMEIVRAGAKDYDRPHFESLIHGNAIRYDMLERLARGGGIDYLLTDAASCMLEVLTALRGGKHPFS